MDKVDLTLKMPLCRKIFLDLQRSRPTRMILPNGYSNFGSPMTHDRNFVLVLSDTEDIVAHVNQVNKKVKVSRTMVILLPLSNAILVSVDTHITGW